MNKFIRYVSLILICVFVLSIPAMATSNITYKYFDDISDYQWAESAINTMYDYGIMSGTVRPTEKSYGKFNPSGNITRAELLVILSSVTGEKATEEFNDVTSNNYFCNSFIEETRSIFEFNDTDNFYGTYYVSREELCFMIANFLCCYSGKTLPNDILNILKFKDYRNVSVRYLCHVELLVASGIINGDSNKNLNPKEMVTRAELAVILNTLLNKGLIKVEKKDVVVPFEKYFNEYPEAAEIWFTFKSFGWSDNVCAGIMGNIMNEIGGQTLDLTVCNCLYEHMPRGYYDGSFGICSWTPGSWYLNSGYGKDLYSQCCFIRDTLASQFGSRLDSFLNAQSPEDAAYMFMKYYERPAEQSGYHQMRNARTAYNYFVVG